MKVFLSVALWGRSYAETFVGYGLASQLSPGNIPKLLEDHQVTYHVVTTHDDAAWMREQPNFRQLCDHCNVIWDFIEDVGFLLDRIPASQDSDKYPFMSRLQNVAFERSLEYDLLIFNYADFIWADGSIPGTVALVDGDVDAVLGFCPPVDETEGKQALDGLRTAGEAFGILPIPPCVSAGIVTDHLHAEARLRIWDGPEFTTTPTYVMWPVGTHGLLVRAYHQTILALRVRADDPHYRAGIRRGTLDGYFSSELAETGSVRFATNSDQVLVFSLYDAIASTRLRAGQTREEALRSCLRNSVSVGQRRYANVAIQIRRNFSDAALWATVEQRSGEIIRRIQDDVPPDDVAFLRHASADDIAQSEKRWRVAAIPARYDVAAPAGPVRKVGLGVLGLLRMLYVGRLVSVCLMPWLGPTQQQWLHQLGSTPRLRVDFRTAISKLAAPISRLFDHIVRETNKGLRLAAGKVSLRLRS
jgi:hypothetical protein